MSVSGTVYGVLSALFVALFSIYNKRTLPEVGDNVLILTFYNNLISVLLFIPLMTLFGEISIIYEYPDLFSFDFWIPMSLSGLLGFGMSYVSAWQIQVTSPLTHNISGTAKAAAQTVMATQWNNEFKTGLWWSSNVLVSF